MENKDPRAFKDVTVFAGDKFFPAADATYKNLIWENIGQFGDPIKNTAIGTIASWGPQFRVNFDLKINSLYINWGVWSSVIAFKIDGGAGNNRKIGDRIPAIFLNKNGFLYFEYHRNPHSSKIPVKLNKWYGITVEQTLENGKVKETQTTKTH